MMRNARWSRIVDWMRFYASWRGGWKETATRILRAHPAGCERDSLLKAIHEAEVQYAKTRRFWG